MTENASFKQVGFLSEHCSSGELAMEIKQSGHYRVCIELNRLAQTILNRCHIHTDDEKEVYLTLHFQRMLSNFQSILIMAERAMTHQIEIMTRCNLELLFNLVAYHLNDDLLEAMIVGNDDQRREVLKKLYQAQQVSPTFTETELAHLRQVINSADEIDRGDIKVFMKAELAGLLNEYRTTYQLLSESVHGSLHSLAADLEIDEKWGAIIGINTCADHSDKLSTLMLTSADYLITGIDIMLKLHKQPEQLAAFESVKLNAQNEWKHIVVKVSHR
ncbi:DUF5677 domain-containing protein [Methylophaga sp. OBS4]|uniref:DUF5677 domain-containing protein n=1 Tax=Methylophaga sp. OBS4 TaxID=2991935 RepID=UPI002259883C|nr:DUF5677 domain-containing protein [Methylophaga sp. OBS4]MCX4186867.1 DUF5677 domain-containing protein [Methylophaga sp. OBS4]